MFVCWPEEKERTKTLVAEMADAPGRRGVGLVEKGRREGVQVDVLAHEVGREQTNKFVCELRPREGMGTSSRDHVGPENNEDRCSPVREVNGRLEAHPVPPQIDKTGYILVSQSPTHSKTRYDNGHGPQMAVHPFQQRLLECPWFPLAREPKVHQGGAMNVECSKSNVQAGRKLTNPSVVIQIEDERLHSHSTALGTSCQTDWQDNGHHKDAGIGEHSNPNIQAERELTNSSVGNPEVSGKGTYLYGNVPEVPNKVGGHHSDTTGWERSQTNIEGEKVPADSLELPWDPGNGRNLPEERSGHCIGTPTK
jgi:hypothetical protein